MHSQEQVWISPNCDRRRWGIWLRKGYGKGVCAPKLTAATPVRSGPEHRIVWIVDARRDNLEQLRDIAVKLQQIRIIGVIGKGAPPKTRGVEWFALLSRNSERATVDKAVAAAFNSMELAAQKRKAIEDLARTECEM